MRQDEVPQDRIGYYGDGRKALYAVDEAGDYRTVASSGWTTEQVVTGDAVAEYQRLAAESLARVRSGASSPLEYHMYALRMDVPMLAETAGTWRWRVRRHLRPRVFARLGDKRLQRYARALGLSVGQLRQVPP